MLELVYASDNATNTSGCVRIYCSNVFEFHLPSLCITSRGAPLIARCVAPPARKLCPATLASGSICFRPPRNQFLDANAPFDSTKRPVDFGAYQDCFLIFI